jgi:hypothetical protein
LQAAERKPPHNDLHWHSITQMVGSEHMSAHGCLAARWLGEHAAALRGNEVQICLDRAAIATRLEKPLFCPITRLNRRKPPLPQPETQALVRFQP